jgi:hypothetical protein
MEEEPKYPKVCAICGETFLGKRANRKYCSDECNWKAQHERKKARNPVRSSQKKVWKDKRQEQYAQQNGKCWLCEQEIELFDLHHMEPNDRSPYSENLVALCKACHNQIHHVTVYIKPDGTLGFHGEALDLLRRKGYEI